jgi:hypothetical protein
MGAGPVLAIALLTLVHFAAFGLLFWHLAGKEIFQLFRLGSDDEGGGGLRKDPPAPDPDGDRDGGLPLPGAAPSSVRLRSPGRLREGYPKPQRRPEHVPAPVRPPVSPPTSRS